MALSEPSRALDQVLSALRLHVASDLAVRPEAMLPANVAAFITPEATMTAANAALRAIRRKFISHILFIRAGQDPRCSIPRRTARKDDGSSESGEAGFSLVGQRRQRAGDRSKPRAAGESSRLFVERVSSGGVVRVKVRPRYGSGSLARQHMKVRGVKQVGLFACSYGFYEAF